MSANAMKSQDRINGLMDRAEALVIDKGGFTEEFCEELRQSALSPNSVMHHIRRKMDDDLGFCHDG